METKIKISNLNLKQISRSGQCFRLNETEDGSFSLIFRDKALRLRQNGDEITFCCPENEFKSIWAPYFDLQTDYEKIIALIPEEDTYLRNAAAFGNGIRILRQDPWEMIITFIISQRKNMPAIRSCVEKISERFGKKISTPFGDSFAFPEPEELASASVEDLLACSLGYRAKYIKETAGRIACGDFDIESLSPLPTNELSESLKTLKGVGEKVANCIILFAYHRLEAFPIDVWIRRIIDNYYGGEFGTSLYGEYAGVIQQYMFFYETGRNS
ncbi:MAG: DNA-3-methyladenine glycosylase family protein [Lachnospiraceae bacterium]|jgi:N-glycosylase/DNA lyase